MRVAYTGLIYRKVSDRKIEGMNSRNILFKVLRLSSYSMNTISSGEIVNLLANDARSPEVLLCFFNYLWVRIEGLG